MTQQSTSFSQVMFNYTVTYNDGEFEKELVPAWIFKVLGVYLSLVCFFGITINGISLLVIIKRNHLKTPTNVFIIAILCNDLVMSLFGIPISAASSFNGYFIWADEMCKFYGFVIYFTSLSSLFIFAATSIYRYLVVSNTTFRCSSRYGPPAFAISLSYGCGLFWSTLPFLGWSKYELEVLPTTCGVTLNSTDPSELGYNISIFVFCFIFPVTVMTFCYTKVVLKLKESSKTLTTNRQSRLLQKRTIYERKLTRTSILIIGVFVFTWTPYSIVVFWRAFGYGKLPVLVGGLPAFLAKSSVVWNPFVYIFSNSDFREALMGLICQGRDERNSSGSVIHDAVNSRNIIDHSCSQSSERSLRNSIQSDACCAQSTSKIRKCSKDSTGKTHAIEMMYCNNAWSSYRRKRNDTLVSEAECTSSTMRGVDNICSEFLERTRFSQHSNQNDHERSSDKINVEISVRVDVNAECAIFI